MWAVALGVIAISRVVSSQNASVPVLGVQTGIDYNTGERPSRLNINDFYARGGPQWDLYIQALQAFQDVNETDEMSYFQISGIHGYPILPWNGVEQVPGGAVSGYCPHNELLFASWHRPFVSLFEQQLVFHARRIAKRYPESSTPIYQAAAQSLRQPYWDWAADPTVPLAVTVPTLSIKGPSGVNTVRNPLSSYIWQSGEPSGPGFGGPLTGYNQTVRCPAQAGTNSAAWSGTTGNLSSGGLTSNTYSVFTQATRYDMMASAGTGGPSFETPHNYVHTNVACINGTLANLGWSAFDPLFMLHHANVDRLIAMWQAIHYNDSMINITGTTHGMFGTAAGSIVGIDTPLKPFFDPRIQPYNSRTASGIKAFGYAYPEINDWAKTPEELATFVTSRVNALYSKDITDDNAPKSGRKANSIADDNPSSLLSYSAEIRVDRSDVPLPSTIDLLLGDHVLGQMALLSMPTRGMSYANIPLEDALQGLNLQGMSEDTLVPYLQQNLEVQVRKSDDGTVFSKRSGIPSLAVELQIRDVVPRTSDSELPKYGVARKWPVSKRP